MRKFASAVLALVAASFPAAAFAQSGSTPAGTYITYTQNVGGSFGNNDPTTYPPLFNDVYTFTTDFARNATVEITSNLGTRPNGTCTDTDHSGCDFSTNVNFVSNGVRLNGTVIPSTSSGVNERRYLFNFRIPTGGLQNIVVRGSAGVNGTYAGLLTLSGVPEPSSWALMIVGFGLTGAALRRRAQPKATVTFA